MSETHKTDLRQQIEKLLTSIKEAEEKLKTMERTMLEVKNLQDTVTRSKKRTREKLLAFTSKVEGMKSIKTMVKKEE